MMLCVAIDGDAELTKEEIDTVDEQLKVRYCSPTFFCVIKCMRIPLRFTHAPFFVCNTYLPSLQSGKSDQIALALKTLSDYLTQFPGSDVLQTFVSSSDFLTTIEVNMRRKMAVVDTDTHTHGVVLICFVILNTISMRFLFLCPLFLSFCLPHPFPSPLPFFPLSLSVSLSTNKKSDSSHGPRQSFALCLVCFMQRQMCSPKNLSTAPRLVQSNPVAPLSHIFRNSFMPQTRHAHYDKTMRRR